MRTVVYFCAGTVADFTIPDDRFATFSKSIDWDLRHSEDELAKAQKVLEAYMIADADEGTAAGDNETLAACFVWSYFNTHPDDSKHVDGDIIIVDLDGNGDTIEYASTADIQLVADE